MNDLGKRLMDDAQCAILSDGDDRIKNIREAMNAVYRFFKGEVKEANFRDPRLFGVFKLERLLKNEFLPLESKPDFDPDESVLFPDSIQNEDDCKQALRFIVHEARKRLNASRDVLTDPLEGCCINSSAYVERICQEHGVKYRTFALGQDLSPGSFHHFDVVSFELADGSVKSYLVDCTYRQFFTYSDAFVERIGMLLNEGGSIGTYMMMSEDRVKMAEQLLRNGYIDFTAETGKVYFDAFVFSGRNGKYYESLGKSQLEASDYEPGYTFFEYMDAIDNGGLDEKHISRQKEPIENVVVFDSDSVYPYLSERILSTEDKKII